MRENSLNTHTEKLRCAAQGQALKISYMNVRIGNTTDSDKW